MADLLAPTPSQTVGPFFAMGLEYPDGPRIAPAGHPDTITLHGAVLDGAGEPVPDALLEFWQGTVPAPGSLRRDGLAFTGFGRVATDDAGQWLIRTLPPVAPPGAGPGHLSVAVFARGLSWHLFTRIYLPGDVTDPGSDPLLANLSPERRATLVAVEEADRVFRFDVHLQGEKETVFLRHT